MEENSVDFLEDIISHRGKEPAWEIRENKNNFKNRKYTQRTQIILISSWHIEDITQPKFFRIMDLGDMNLRGKAWEVMRTKSKRPWYISAKEFGLYPTECMKPTEYFKWRNNIGSVVF